ncbi:Metallo-dependent phosphatase-like protein [Mycena sp. CBHHK59/15]|nr:Metallo-dependent phosphatase-like protein [Mycena sp. CBHHK59/15]
MKQLLRETLLREICTKTQEVVMRESNVVHVSSPIKYYPRDYVDRGLFSLETISLLTIQLIRGNHESRAITSSFYLECTRKYGSSRLWTYFTDMFDFFKLMLSVLIDDEIFCVHGFTLIWRLSPSIHSIIDQIKVLDLFREVSSDGPMTDFMWSDPDPEREDFAISPRSASTFGAGYTFGAGIHKFLETNHMSSILRAHQLCMEGCTTLFHGHLSTVWSASNYCYRAGNAGCVLEVGPRGSTHFNNARDGPPEQAALSANGMLPEYFL